MLCIHTAFGKYHQRESRVSLTASDCDCHSPPSLLQTILASTSSVERKACRIWTSEIHSPQSTVFPPFFIGFRRKGIVGNLLDESNIRIDRLRVQIQSQTKYKNARHSTWGRFDTTQLIAIYKKNERKEIMSYDKAIRVRKA